MQGFATLTGSRNPLLAAAIDMHNGRCLVELARIAEGKAAIARGLPVLVAKGEAFTGDVYDARLALGRAAQREFDYDAAAREYRTAVELVKGGA